MRAFLVDFGVFALGLALLVGVVLAWMERKHGC